MYEKKSRMQLDRLQNKFTHCKAFKITQFLDKLLVYKTNWIQHNRLPRIMELYSPTGRNNRDILLKKV